MSHPLSEAVSQFTALHKIVIEVTAVNRLEDIKSLPILYFCITASESKHAVVPLDEGRILRRSREVRPPRPPSGN
jgi:hypothetical protein